MSLSKENVMTTLCTEKYEGFRECHINPDWLLIYRKDNDELILHLTRTRTHSDLF